MKKQSIKELGYDSIMIDNELFAAVYVLEKIIGYEDERVFLTYREWLENDSIYLFRATIRGNQIRMNQYEYERYHEFVDNLKNGYPVEKYGILMQTVMNPIEKSNLCLLE